MSISEKLKTIAENEERVFNAGNLVGIDEGFYIGYENGKNIGHVIGTEEGYELGYAEGTDDGYAEGYAEGTDDGYADGYEEGYVEGVDAGYEDGYAEGEDDGYMTGLDDGWHDGVQAEYDRFWDLYQRNGERTSYEFAFTRSGWTDETFTPKYDLILAKSQGSMFAYCDITDLAGILRHYKIAFSTTDATDIRQMFQGAKVLTTIPEMDIRNVTSLAYTFQNCPALYRIEKIISAETTPFASTTFNGSLALVDVTFEGTIGISLTINNSSKLSVDSIKSIISCLKNYVGTDKQDTETVKFHANSWAALEASGSAPHGGTWREYVIEQLGWLV